jgi:hypothetical protein
MEGIVKHFVAKTALTAVAVVGPVVGMSAGSASASPVYGGAVAIASPWYSNARFANLQVASAYGSSYLVNNVQAQSLRGCQGCRALAVNVQVDLVSDATTPPNESDVATVVDRGSGDTNLAAAAMFVVTSPGRVNLSGSGWAQLGSIEWQLRSLSLSGSSAAAVQGTISSLLGQVVQILESDVTTTSPAVTPAPATSTKPGVPRTAVSPVTPAVAPAASAGVQITSNIQFGS